MTNPNDDMLDDLFAQSRATVVTPSDDLVARVLGDADAVQAGFATTKATPSPGPWARMMDAIGGWPALGGLAAATVAGIWVGVAPPGPVEDLTASILGDEISVSLISGDLTFVTGEMLDG